MFIENSLKVRENKRGRNVVRDVIGLISTPRRKYIFFHNKVKQLLARPVGTERCSRFFFALLQVPLKQADASTMLPYVEPLCRH